MKTTVVFIAGLLSSFIVFSLQKSAAATANTVADFSQSSIESRSSFCTDGRSIMRPSVDVHPSSRTASTAAQAGSSCAAISQSSIVNCQSKRPARATISNFKFPTELPVIAAAAKANGITTPDHFALLLAIRCAENGRDGRQFGVLHPRAVDTDLRTQAGWAAATLVANQRRWSKTEVRRQTSELTMDGFIDFLAARYCPPSVDPVGHENWKKNVKFYFKKFYHEAHNCKL